MSFVCDKVTRTDNMKEIRENNGTLVITGNDAPAGMGCTQDYSYYQEEIRTDKI
jgi:hypothetical protein